MSKENRQTNSASLQAFIKTNEEFPDTHHISKRFLHQRPALFQVRLPVLGEKCGEAALLQQTFGVVLSGELGLFPAVWYRQQLALIHYVSDKRPEINKSLGILQ